MSIVRASILALTLALPQAALAQPAAGNVNDCTQLQDPVALRNCILRYEGVRTQVPQTIESAPPAAATAPDSASDAAGDGITEVPTPPRPRSTAARKPPGTRPASPQQPAVPAQAAAPAADPAQSAATPPPQRPNPKDTLVHIEQIEVPRSRH